MPIKPTMKIVPLIFTMAIFIFSKNTTALPVGAQVGGGNAVIQTTNNTMLIEQSSPQLSLNFESFSISPGELVRFNQPNRESVALNRVTGRDASEIFGQLQSNGQIFLLNPNGILFGQDAQLNVGGLMATTLNISDDDFFQGRWSLTSSESNGISPAILNQGKIQTTDQGYIAFVAPDIQNQGELLAPSGTVALHSADKVLMSFAGHQLLSIETNQAGLKAAIKNSGEIYADGGQVLLTAAATDALLETVIDNSGIISAQRIEQSGGRIFLSGGDDDTLTGDIINSGLIDASQQVLGDGGSIDIQAGKIAQLGLIKANAKSTGNGGDINLLSQDALVIANGSQTLANADEQGDGGYIRYFTFGQAAFYNSSLMEAKGGQYSGDGGFVEVSGVEKVFIDGQVDTSATNGKTGLFYIDPTNIDIKTTVATPNGAFNTGGGFSEWVPDTLGSSEIGTAQITSLLASNNVTIDTARANTGADLGTLTVSNDINLNGGDGNTLKLVSHNIMSITSNICDMGGGSTCLASPDDAVNLEFDTKTLNSNGHISVGGIEINSGGGDITFTSDAGLTLGTGGNIIAGAGNIMATIDDTITLGDSTSISSTTGTIGLISGAQSIDMGISTSIASTSGAITLAANQDITMVDTSSINSGSSTLALTTTSGDISLANLTSTSVLDNAITITSGNLIQDVNTTALVADVSAVNGGVVLVAQTGISRGGVAMDVDALKIDVTNNASSNVILHALSGTEVVDVDVTGTFTLVSDATGNDILFSGFTKSTGSIIVTTDDNLTINDGVVMDAGNSRINLTATNGNATVTGLLTTKTASTDVITITAGGSILDGGNTNIDLSAANGDITLSAVTGIVDIETTASEGNFTNTTSGNVVINESSDIEIQTINVAADFELNSQGSIDLITGALTSVSGLNLDATNNLVIPNTGIDIGNGASQILNLQGADIYNKDLSRVLNLTAEALSFSSSMLSGNTTLTTNVDLLNVVQAGTNTLTVNETDSVSVGLVSMENGTVNINTAGAGDLTVNLIGGSLAGTGGSLNLTAANNLNIDADIDGSAGATNITLSATAGSLNVANGITVGSGGGNIVLSANTVGQEVTVINTASVDSGTGKIIISGDVVKVSGISSTNADDDAISITSNTDIQDNGGGLDIRAENGGVILIANTGIHDTTGLLTLDVKAAKIDATNTVSGAINLDVRDGTNLVDIDSVGDFSLVTNAGINDVTISNITNIGGAIDIAMEGTLTIPDAGLISSSTLALNVANIVDSSGAVTLGGTTAVITLGDVAGGITIDSSFDALSLTGTGTDVVTINELNDLSITSLSVVGGSTINTGGNLSVDSHIDLNGMNGSTLTLNAVGDLTLNGNICEGGVTCAALDDSVVLDFDAGGNFTTAGNIAVKNGAANINIDAVGSVTFNTGDTLIAGGDIAITGNSVNIAGIQSTSTSATAVQISSATNILNQAGVDITALTGGVVLTSSTGIVGLDTNVASLSATNTASGDIVINESNDLSITQLSNVGSITVNTGGDLSLDSNLDLNGMNGAALTLNAGGDLMLNANICEGGAACSSVDDVVLLDFDSAGDISTIGNITVHSGGGNVSLDAVGTMALSQGDIVNSGTGQINVTGGAVIVTGLQSTASGNAITVTSATNILERTGTDASAVNGLVSLNATSGILGGGVTEDFDVVAQEISVSNTSSGEVRLNGGSNNVTLASVDVSGLMLVNTTSGSITLQENALVSANDISFNSDSADIILPSSIALPGRLSLQGSQVNNANQIIDVSAQELLIKTTANQDLVLNINDALVDVFMNGDGDLQVNASTGLTLADLDGDSSTVTVSNGNVLINTITGDLNIEANISASDTLADGIRSGTIELSVSDGDLIIGALNSVAITSTNTVDQNVPGGLTADGGSQVSIYAHLNDQDDISRTIALGNNSGSDVSVMAVGGDIFLDALNGANLVTANNRSLLIYSDVTLTSYNQVTDAQSGVVTNEGVRNLGVAQAHLDRKIELLANGVTLTAEEIEEIKETVADEVQDNKPENVEGEANNEQVGTDMDRAFSAVFDQCQVSNEKDGECGARLAIKKFLGSLLIGGTLPK
jgi:filamentous hemagglutinin family protein